MTYICKFQMISWILIRQLSMRVGIYALSTMPQTTVVKAKFMFFTVSGCRVMRSRGVVVSWYGGVRGGITKNQAISTLTGSGHHACFLDQPKAVSRIRHSTAGLPGSDATTSCRAASSAVAIPDVPLRRSPCSLESAATEPARHWESCPPAPVRHRGT